MNAEGKPINNKPGFGLLLLGASGLCFYFAWHIFQAAERTNNYILQTCGNSAKGLGGESLRYYADCVSAGSVSAAGAWVMIILAIILGIIGLINLASKNS